MPKRIEDLPQIERLPANNEILVPVCERSGMGFLNGVYKINVEQLIERIIIGVLEGGEIQVKEEDGCLAFSKIEREIR